LNESDNGGGDERWRDAPPPQSRQPEPTRAERRADVKAEKARAKAMRPWYRKKRFAIPLGLVVLVVVMSALGGDEDGSQVAETSADGGAVESEPASVAEAAPQDEPEPDVLEDEPDPQPEMTVAQEQAVQSASSYLDSGGFSRRGLIKQLTSDAGDAYTGSGRVRRSTAAP